MYNESERKTLKIKFSVNATRESSFEMTSANHECLPIKIQGILRQWFWDGIMCKVVHNNWLIKLIEDYAFCSLIIDYYMYYTLYEMRYTHNGNPEFPNVC